MSRVYEYAPKNIGLCPKCNRDTLRKTQTESTVNPGTWTIVYFCEGAGCAAKYWTHIKNAARKENKTRTRQIGFTPALGCQVCKRPDVKEWILGRGGVLMCRDCKHHEDEGTNVT